jgi:hypothetical protein
MSGDDLATALTSGGATWLTLSLAAVLPILWAFVLVLHFARPYIIRFLGGLTLRFGGDVWWLSYVLMRDGLMMVAFALGMVFLMPNLYIGLALPLTAPLATVGIFWALVIKFIRDADDDPIAYRWVSIVLFVSSILYIVPQIYGLESADQVDRLKGIGLDWVPGALSAASGDPATVNPLAWPIYWLAVVLVALTGAFLFIRFFRGLGATDAAEGGVPAAG